MRFLFLIYVEPPLARHADSDISEHLAFATSEVRRRTYVTANALKPDLAATVRVRNDERMVTDGPFAETREVLGGFYMMELASWEDALEMAARMPKADRGTIEVRQIQELPGWDDAIREAAHEVSTSR
jgi:hypothetical protein